MVEEQEKSGRMTEYGRQRIAEAKQNGTFKPKDRLSITQEMIDVLTSRLCGIEPALSNFLSMSPSVKRTYTALANEGKSEATRQKTFEKIVDRLNRNQKPM